MLLCEKKKPGIFLGQAWCCGPDWAAASAAAFYWSWAVYRVCSSQTREVPLSGLSDVCLFEKENRRRCLVVEVKPEETELLWGCCVWLCVCYQKKKPSRTLNSCPFLIGTCTSEALFVLINRAVNTAGFFFLGKIHLLRACILQIHTFQLVRSAQQKRKKKLL